MISVLILTYNEEANLPDCLKSIQWCDDIVVFDSFSTDRTIEIANASNIRVFQRKFDNYATQRNTALHEIKYKYPWVLMIDADERWNDELYIDIKNTLSSSTPETCLYYFRRKDMFLGRWLRRASGYPTWAGRLVRTGRVKVRREINEEYVTDGDVGYIKGHFIHYPFNKGIAFWFERHNRYSSMEAEKLVEETKGRLQFKDLFSKNPGLRRKFLKQLAYRLPGRPVLVFLYLYFFRLGFIDGHPGLAYCIMRSIYEYMIDLKVIELKRREQHLPI